MSVLASIIPGITVAPPASTTLAPDGTPTLAPTASILLALMTMVPLSIVGPDTVTMRAFVMAQTVPAVFALMSYRSAAGVDRGAAGAPCGAASAAAPRPRA